jgi:acyl-coenzyme A synthetase/AMP-(fatty) acid ligase
MVLCYAEESDALVSSLNHHLPKLATEIMPSLEELLNMTEHVEHYEYDKTFNEAKDEPCLILHSSGSTGQSMSYDLSDTNSSCILTINR